MILGRHSELLLSSVDLGVGSLIAVVVDSLGSVDCGACRVGLKLEFVRSG